MRGEADHLLPELPPLRVHHFLLATACVAMVAAYQGWSGSLVFDSAYRTMVAEAFRAVTGILQSLAALILLLLLKWRYYDHARFQIEPGHWLLLMVSIEFLLTAIFGNLYMRLGNQEDFSEFLHIHDMLFRIFPQFLVAGVCAAAYGLCKEKEWRRFFLACLLIALCGATWLSLQLIPAGVMSGVFEFYWIPWWLHQPTIIFVAPGLQLALISMAIRGDRIASI